MSTTTTASAAPAELAPTVAAARNAAAYKPTHPALFKVVFGKQDFSSKLVTTRAFAKGEVVAKIEGTTFAKKRYTTVQVGKDSHIELNSDLVYMNHSCNPSASMDTDQMAVVATRDLAAGDELTFFYPSSEWDMDQPFDCWCGAPLCIKRVQGAKHIPADVLSRYWVASHIKALKDEQVKAEQAARK
ncbi:hypothetical protein AMAG_10326 [Allomyces macrogynus ATCC 38327]|uniref:SET domain-containing protein n=1 Tax=Allomyces macrogynus (strain ATCC 38327) TaxID=578462 RepID=A0A0L0SU31_ALLM3|nr:hypothetical protein AMAG_10326 [Allomyces macrogynus ATCC 38327]|eukprot:KNE66063.1 hypothetical protein AMAG_10326 [Allomyces macrogynus ATCC 38327]